MSNSTIQINDENVVITLNSGFLSRLYIALQLIFNKKSTLDIGEIKRVFPSPNFGITKCERCTGTLDFGDDFSYDKWNDGSIHFYHAVCSPSFPGNTK